MRLFLATSLDGSLGNLAAALVRLDDRLDDTDGDGLTHVTHGKPAKRRVVSESFDAHGLGRNHLHDGSVTRLDELGVIFDRLAGAAIDLLQELGKLAGDMGGMAV